MREKFDDEGGIQYPNHGIVGIINIESHIFIVIISEKKLVAKMPSSDFVYLVTGVEFIPFDKNIPDYTKMPIEIVKYVEGIKKVLQEQGFYYSNHADITSSQQRQANVKFEQSFGINYSYAFRDKHMDKRYHWNKNITRDFTY